MAATTARVTVECPRGTVMRRFIGPSADEALKKALRLEGRDVGPGCRVRLVELVKRGVGAGAADRYSMAGARRRRRRRR